MTMIWFNGEIVGTAVVDVSDPSGVGQSGRTSDVLLRADELQALLPGCHLLSLLAGIGL